MRKIIILMTCLSIISSLVACSNSTANANSNERAMQASTQTQMITGEVSVTGKVTQIYGNEVKIRLTEDNNTQTSNERPNMTSGDGETPQRPDMSEMSDEDRAAMRENMMSGDGATSQRGQRNNTDEATTSSIKSSEINTNLESNLILPMSIGHSFTTSIISNGGGGGDRANMSDADRQAMMEMMEMMGGNSSGDRTSMMGGGTTSTSTADLVLTNEIAEYTIPVGTPVYSFGTALSFSQISEDAFITIYMNKDGNILSVNILG